MISEARQKPIAEMQEERARENRAHVTGMPNLIYLESLHQSGKERFSENDICDRWGEDLHHNTLVSSIRKNHSAAKEENQSG